MIRRLAVAAVAPLALTTLVACGGDGESASDDAATSSSAPAETEESDEPADQPAEGEEVEPAEFMETFEAAFEDATTAHLSMEMEAGGGEMSAEGDADYTGEMPDLAMTMSGSLLQGQDMEARMVDGIFYMKMPAMGEKFLRVDLSDPNNPLGPQLTKQLDPKAMFEGFADSIETVVYEGEEDVDGETTDAYSVTVDAQAVIEQSGQQLPPGIELPKQITYELNFTEDGLFRRMETEMGDALGTVVVEMTDWGSDVTIEAPPADQVTEFPDGTTTG